MKSCFYRSDIGIIKISTDDNKSINALHFCKTQGRSDKSSLLEQCIEEIDLYFKGKLKKFNTPIAIQGSEFEQRVYKELCAIPFAKLRSYKDIAKSINAPKAFRAIGNANSKNKIAIIIPCHRVIKSNGELGGYNAGENIKRALLDLEKSFS